MKLLDRVHAGYVFGRRVRVLAELLGPGLPEHSRVLDVGCGDGTLASLILRDRPDLKWYGIDTLVRSTTAIPVQSYDGRTIPFPDLSFDVVLFVDVLHHVDEPAPLLAEALRVARRGLLIKDHTADGWLPRPTL